MDHVPPDDRRSPTAARPRRGRTASRGPVLDARYRAGVVGGDTRRTGGHTRRGDERDTAWLHRALDALDTSFPAPRLVCLFGDECTFSFGSRTWDAVTFPPGRPVGFGPRPTLAAIGAFLARFHLANLSAGDGIGPRPGGARLAQLASLVDWEGDTSATVGSETKAHRVRRFSTALPAPSARPAMSTSPAA